MDKHEFEEEVLSKRRSRGRIRRRRRIGLLEGGGGEEKKKDQPTALRFNSKGRYVLISKLLLID